jgi:hypothetical protein
VRPAELLGVTMNAPSDRHYDASRSARAQAKSELLVCSGVAAFFVTLAALISPSWETEPSALAGFLIFVALFAGFMAVVVKRCARQFQATRDWRVQITDEEFIYTVPDEHLDAPLTISLRQIVRISKTTIVDMEGSSRVEWCFFDAAGTCYEPCRSSPFPLEPIFATLRRAAPWAQFVETKRSDAAQRRRSGFSLARVLAAVSIAVLGFMILLFLSP